MNARLIFTFLMAFPIFAGAKDLTIRTCITRGATDYHAFLESIKLPNPARNLLFKVAKDFKSNIVFDDSEVNRCLQFAKDGTLDAMYPMTMDPAVEPLFEFPPVGAQLALVKWNIYTRVPADSTQALKSTKEIKEPVGLTFDYMLGKSLTEQGITIEQTAKTPEDLVRQLITKRVNIILINNYDFAKARRSFKPDEIKNIKLNFTLQEKPASFMFTKKFNQRHPGFATKFYARIIAEKKKKSYIEDMQKIDKALE